MKRIAILLLLVICVAPAWSQQRKIQNRPYIDQRRFHYGFSIGLNFQDYEFTNLSFVNQEGEQWMVDVADYAPGFSVGVLGELYLTRHLALRFLPSLHFGSKNITFRDYSGLKGEEKQSVKSAYLATPVELKFSAPRVNNYRPYLMAGISPTYDLGLKKGDHLLFKPMDCYLEIGLGCDYYFPFFKFIPELKFCFGLANILNKNREDLTDESLMKFTESVTGTRSKMFVLTFYFE